MIIYITANDTEIGKTFVTSLILNSLSTKNKLSKIAMIKPIESGVKSLKELVEISNYKSTNDF